MPKTPFMRSMLEARQTADNMPDQYLGYSPADVDYLIKHYAMREPSSSVQESVDPGAAMLMSPAVGLKGALRGALSIPGFLGDIANYAHGATSVATGHPENVTMPDDFKYGQQGLADWLAENVPGLGYDEQLPQADAMGELLGNLTPARIARHAAGVAAKPIRAIRSINVPTEAAAASVRSLESPRAIRTSAPKQLTQSFAAGGLARIAARLGAEATPARRGVAEVIKNKGGNWLSGSVEEAVNFLKAHPEVQPSSTQKIAQEKLNKWLEGPLTKYIKRDMATENDPLVRLANAGVVIGEPAYTSVPGKHLQAKRRELGFNPEAFGETDAAKALSNTLDELVITRPAKVLRSGQLLQADPWLNQVEPSTPVHSLDTGFAYESGLGHLVDELRNALDPTSGLPKHLQINPQALESGNFSVDAAARRVNDIGKWRADTATSANQMRANNAATVLHKEYPHSEAAPNPKGLRWVELKTPGDFSEAAGTKFEEGIPTDDPEAFAQGIAKWRADKEDAKKQLQDALKYEGDTMGHCVGGYCDNVASGKSRIYSLRDAKGQPHVTIEAAPEEPTVRESLKGITPPSRIIQIKGKGNLIPADEYQPFVQDFVKSGKWSDVGDLQNAGLVEHLNKPGVYITPEEASQLMQDPFERGRPELNFAKGGTVSQLRATIEQLRKKHAR